MDNQDKVFNQFKTASDKMEAKDFPAIDKVWSRVEDKLDNKVLKKENKTWKKMAIAASVLLLCSIGYQVSKTDNNVPMQTGTVTTVPDSSKSASPEIILQENPVADAEESAPDPGISNPIIKSNADAILKRQLRDQQPIGYQGGRHIKPGKDLIVIDSSGYEKYSDKIVENELDAHKGINKEKTAFTGNARKFNAKIAERDEREDGASGYFTVKSTLQAKAENPALVVIDGKAVIKGNNQTYGEAVKKDLAKMDADDLQSIVKLPEPLYIINGIEYTEQELFGKAPTSPYAPLSKQEIEAMTILQGEQAIEQYGEKGAKGVVIITTKKGKPAKKQ